MNYRDTEEWEKGKRDREEWGDGKEKGCGRRRKGMSVFKGQLK